jgi:hypothetical protein
MTEEKLIALWTNRHSNRPTLDRKIRAVVAHQVHTGHVLHIYSAAQLEVKI